MSEEFTLLRCLFIFLSFLLINLEREKKKESERYYTRSRAALYIRTGKGFHKHQTVIKYAMTFFKE